MSLSSYTKSQGPVPEQQRCLWVHWHSGADQECAFEWSFFVIPSWQHKTGVSTSHTLLRWNSTEKWPLGTYLLCFNKQRVVIVWDQPELVQRKPSRACSVVVNLQLHFFSLYRPFETTCFYGCSLWMPGAPEILEFNSRVNSSPRYVFLEAFRGTYSILEREVITVWELVTLDPYREMQDRCLEELGPIQGWPYLALNQYLLSLLTLWPVTSLYDRHLRVAEAVMCNSCIFIVDKLRSSNLKLSRASLKGDWLDG